MFKKILDVLFLRKTFLNNKSNNKFPYAVSITNEPLIYLDENANWKRSERHKEAYFMSVMFQMNEVHHKKFLFDVLNGFWDDAMTIENKEGFKRTAKRVLKENGFKSYSNNLEKTYITELTQEEKEQLTILLNNKEALCIS